MFPVQTLFLVQTPDHRPCCPCPTHVLHMSPLVPLVSLPVALHAALCLVVPVFAIYVLVLVLLAVAIGSRSLRPSPPIVWRIESSLFLGQPAPSPSWRRRSTCSHAWEQTYHANWSLVSPRHEYKPPIGPRTSDDPTWSNGWAAIGVHLDMIAKQYKKGTRMGVERGKTGLERGQEWVWKGVKMGLERGQKLVLNGIKNGISPDSTIWNGVQVPFFAVPHLSSLFFVVPALFSPVFDNFRQKQEKRSSKNGGMGKERKAFFPVSFPFPFFPFPFQEHLYSP